MRRLVPLEQRSVRRERKMRVLHVVQALARNFGGPQTVLQGLIKAQRAAGLDVEVVSTNVDAPHGVLSVPPNCFVEQGGVWIRYSSVQFRPLLFSIDLKTYFERSLSRYDIVHIHGLYRFPPTYAAYQARKQSVPYIIRPFGSLDPYLYKRSSRSVLLKRLYERWFDFPNLNGADAIHYVAEEERERAAFLNLKAPSFVVPNGIDWEEYESLPERGAMRARWGIGDAPMVLFLGRLHFKKGLDLLVAAFDDVRRKIPDAQLVIAGPEHDDYGQTVRRWVRERGLEGVVHFVGPLNRPQVVQAYVDADVFALPSYTEPFPLAAAEAMACGLPVLISDQVNIHAEVTKAGAGVVTRCDADDVAAAMEALLRDTERRRRMGDAGRRLVETRYTWPVIEQLLRREYEAAIDRHVKRRAVARVG